MTEDAKRQQMYERALNHIDIKDAKQGQPIIVIVDPWVEEPCTLMLQLTGADGRTYAQRELRLAADPQRINLSATVNLPSGDYEIVVTPPLTEYFAMIRIDRRIALSVADAQSGSGPAPVFGADKIEDHQAPVERITDGQHHYFGYYDKFPWNASGRYHLALETTFLDRQPTRDDVAVIGMIDTQESNRWISLAETTAWSWQQGTMLQWLPSEPEHTIIYNVRENDSFFAVIHNIETGEKRRLSRSFYAVCEDYAVGLNYARLHQTRPGYGYSDGIEDTLPDPHPADDGVYRIDLESGDSELLISLQQLFEFETIPRMHQGPHWVNHLTISPGGSNFVFLNRCQFDPRKRFNDRFFCAAADGSDLRLVHDNTYFSHFGYLDERRIVAYARTPGTEAEQYALYDLDTDKFTVIGKDVFSSDGHCSISPNRKWMLTDTYPDAQQNRTLILFELDTGRRVNIGTFYSPPELKNEIRCDLHPRWSRDGKKVSIDSAHEGSRQVYVIDVRGVVG